MKIFMETYGCAANGAESEIMSGLLDAAGFDLVEKPEESDVIIINTCFVKTQTEQKIKDRIKRILGTFPEKKIVVAGCMPGVKGNGIEFIAPDASLVDTHNTTRIVDAVRSTFAGERVVFTGDSGEKKLRRPRMRENPHVGITKISHGCNGECSYCCVRLAKGPLHCYHPEDIVKDVEDAVREGCSEIWLTSQDNASYEYNGVRLPEIIRMVCQVKGEFMVRVGMMNPDSVLPVMDELIEAYGNEKIYKFIHIPVQSGSDSVLKLMKRKYMVKEFSEIVSKFRKEIPEIFISTDMIVGFPGETEQDFSKSLELVKCMKPDMVNVSKFGARPGTEAADMVMLDGAVLKERSEKLSDAARRASFEANRKWTGWEGNVTVTERGRKPGQFLGKNFACRPVVIESKKDILGSVVQIKIEGAGTAYLKGSYHGN